MFPPTAITRLRQMWAHIIDDGPYGTTPPANKPTDLTIPPRQPFPLTFLAHVAHHAQDKDWQYPLYLRDNDGGPLGMDEELPQHPHVFPNDETRAEHADIQPLQYDLANYGSARENVKTVRDEYLLERQLGMTAGPLATSYP